MSIVKLNRLAIDTELNGEKFGGKNCPTQQFS
jgi:hypothetical protein